MRLIEDAPGCTVPPVGFSPVSCKDTTLTAFAQLGALRLNVNRGMISLIDGGYQYILAEATRTLSLIPEDESPPQDDLWLGSVIIPRRSGVCEHVLSLGDFDSGTNRPADDVPAIVINDLARDKRFSGRSYVSGSPGVRFYAGVPLRSPWGSIIGAYCVFGHEPRDGLDHEALLTLQGIAKTTMSYLDTSKAKEGHKRYGQMLDGLTSFVIGESSLQSFGRDANSLRDSPLVPKKKAIGRGKEPSLPQAGRGARSTPDKSKSPLPRKSQQQAKASDSIEAQKLQKQLENAKTSLPTGSRKNSMSLQESILPSGAKEMFSRAANIIKQSTDIDGCIIFDATIVSFGGGINTPRGRKATEAHASKSRSESHQRNEDSFPPSSEEYDPSHSSAESRNTDEHSDSEHKEHRMCEILGFACNDGSSMDGDDPDVFCEPFAESDMKRLLKKYPFGHIFNIGRSGEVSPCREQPPRREMRDFPNGFSRVDPYVEKLLKIDPCARSLLLLPLWDYSRERFYAGTICWTTEPNRVFYPDVDLVFLQAFGNSLMTELSRLDAITSDKAKTTFVASISHELRCPLNGILGSVHFLSDTKVDAYQASLLDSVAMCGNTLLDTIDHVLDFAKVNNFKRRALKGTQKSDGKEGKGPDGLSQRDSGEIEYLTSDTDLATLTEEVVEAVFVGQAHKQVPARLQQILEDDEAVRPGESSSPAYFLVSHSVPNYFLPGQKTETNNLQKERPEAQSNSSHTKFSKEFLVASEEANKTKDTVRIVLDIPYRANWFATTEPGAWRRVVMNLLGNSIKYTAKGFIKVSMRADDGDEHAGNERIKVTFKITDTGKGISPEYLRTGLWQPFSQEDSFSPGTGLGLSIVRQILDTLHGHVAVKSEVNVGTEVTVTLSVPTAEKMSSPSGSPNDLISALKSQLEDRSVRILEHTSLGGVTNSEPSVRKGQHELAVSIKRIFKDWFCSEAVASHIWDALSADILVCLELNVDFLSALQRLRREEKRLVVIFIALDSNQAAKMCADPRIQSGDIVIDVITQPCGPRKLAKTLTQALNRLDADLQKMPLTTTPSNSPLEEIPSGKVRPSISRQMTRRMSEPAPSLSETIQRSKSQMSMNAEPSSSAMQQPPTEKDLRILLVDDNRINLSVRDYLAKQTSIPQSADSDQLLTAFMKKYRFAYSEATNGLEAVETYKRDDGCFDYILMDLTMPVMDGLTATREIRRFELRAHCAPATVIALTGLANAATRVEALSSGVNYFLTKPVRFQALYAMLSDGGGKAGEKRESDGPGAGLVRENAWEEEDGGGGEDGGIVPSSQSQALESAVTVP
ncbi:hypothetical protein IWX90DRAFT_411142 [Phyllosticta citrichinensis]|uniref:histidine kinase n=1 Tax=Phyllosticta citrichinensis TaxID=1130410 RepID=A0ABR1Y7V4_9PEZI